MPNPEPEPEQFPPTPRQRGKGSRSRSDEHSADFEAWYAACPCKAGKEAAAKAYEGAQRRLQAQRIQSRDEVAGFLLKRATTYAESPSGKRGQFVPHPATWLNQGRYLDADAEWQRNDSGRGTVQAGDGQVAAGDTVGW